MNRTKNNGLTFNSILLAILAIGTIVVCGLMFKLYDELTKTPEKTAQLHQQQQQIEIMSPSIQKEQPPIYQESMTNQSATLPTNTTLPTNETSLPLPTQQPDVPLNSSASYPIANQNTPVHSSDHALPSIPPTQQEDLQAKTRSERLAGEVPLLPINIPQNQEQVLSPANSSVPKNQTNEKKPNQDAIGELF